jgi:heme-degrading monooxygenase HmoA
LSQEVPVFARVSSYEIPPEQVGDATTGLQQAIGQIRAMNGLAAAYLLVNAETGRVLTMTLWDNAAAMEASHVTASRLRTEAIRAVNGSVLSIEEYEVAARELGDVT